MFCLIDICGCPEELNMHLYFSWSFSQNFRQEQRRMNKGNCSSLADFIFLGITDNPGVKVTLFSIFLDFYLINLLVNLGMIISVRINSQLHTPGSFFLSHLSFCDLCYSTAIGLKMLVDLFAKNCGAQW